MRLVLLKALSFFVSSFFLYQPRLKEHEVRDIYEALSNPSTKVLYKVMLKDAKSNSPHPLTKQFLEYVQGLDEIARDIIAFDLKKYYEKGNNNLAKLSVKYYNYSESSIKSMKSSLKTELRVMYSGMYGYKGE